MEPSNEIVRLLTEIRDGQREFMLQSQQTAQEWRELSMTADAKADAQNKQSVSTGRGLSWAFLILIAVCVASNFLMLLLVAGRK